ncbi:MAG: DddA-like double-stranded DNA deaminase toxin [Stackebrandtia sp.]
MAGLDDFVAALEAAKPHLDTAQTEIARGCSSGDEVASALAAAEVRERAEVVRDAADRAREGSAAIESAKGVLDQAIAAAKRAKGEGGLTTAPTPQARPPSPQLESHSAAGRIPNFTAARPVGECVEAIKRLGWPKNAEGNVSARGLLFSRDGKPLTAEPLRAHHKGQASPCEDLKEPWRSDSELTTTWHAERDAAARMRRDGLESAVLYLNVPTCGKESQDAGRCHVNLPKILPAGSTLTVWSVHEDGWTRQRRYKGTGEAIK